MTKFVNKNFDYNGMYLHYGEGIDRRFVARFKNGGVVAFKKFLRENFTVEEYFDLLGSQNSISCSYAPLKILESKGYVSPNACKILKKRGYPQTLEGRNQMTRDQADLHVRKNIPYTATDDDMLLHS
tara:strand:- start:707 stop:1087 length:381 start_codon:yes stop_codon:yes gene_type:complete